MPICKMKLLMTGCKPGFSGVGNDHSAKCLDLDDYHLEV